MKKLLCMLTVLFALVCGFTACDTDETPHTHTFGEWGVTTAATCSSKGVETHTCACGESETREIAATGVHTYVQGVCSCGAKEPASAPLYTRDGNKIYFGAYPQTEVTDTALVTTLNGKAGTLPTSTDAKNWTSYGYYIEGNVQNYMWFIDVNEGAEKYRGVYFTSYRPVIPTDVSLASNSSQDDNGFVTGTTYWFKHEPIVWRVLKEENDTALLLCDMAIDSQAYQNEYTYDNNEYYTSSNGAPNGTYANNYAYSTIRHWLNDTFYATAFTELQREIILITTVDNSAESTGEPSNLYVCADTQDKVFLMSMREVTSVEYGFREYEGIDETRKRQATDYAQVQGIANLESGDSVNNPWWWLRSSFCEDSVYIRAVREDGYVEDDVSSVICAIGVVPAMWIQLD